MDAGKNDETEKFSGAVYKTSSLDTDVMLDGSSFSRLAPETGNDC